MPAPIVNNFSITSLFFSPSDSHPMKSLCFVSAFFMTLSNESENLLYFDALFISLFDIGVFS